MEKEIIILAKSRKKNDFCIAGIEVSTGKWIRPISNNTELEGAVPLDDFTYKDGSEVQIFDKVKIQFKSYNPTKSQPENYIYDSECYWQKTGLSNLSELIKLRGFDNPNKIFYNTNKSVSINEIGGEPSLLLVNVKNSDIFIYTYDDGNSSIQFNFEYNDERYTYFKITDLVVKNEYQRMSFGNYNKRTNLVVVFSLTDKHSDDKYYKVVPQLFYD